MGPPPGGELIEFCIAASVGGLPFGGEQLFVFEAVEGWIERPLLDLQGFPGHLLDPLGNGISMNGAEGNDAEDEQVEGALREVEFAFGLHAYRFYI
jgi:hypothetical protein